jgi:hypothetical protein
MALSFIRSRVGLCAAIAAGLALLARPVHAEVGSTRRVEVRIELSAESGPALATALEPGGEADLDAVISSAGGEIEPTACDAHLATAPDGSAAAVNVAGCANTSVAAVAQVSLDPAAPGGVATASFDGHGGSGGAAFCLLPWIIIIIIIIILN